MLPNVAFLRWPEEAAVVAYLRTQGRLRLLLVAPDADPPASSGWDEDWIRLPARDDDIRARAEALHGRAALSDARPEDKGDGRLFFQRRWVSLSPTEEAMARLLSERFGEVIDADTLAVCAGGSLTPTAVRVHLTRLRKRIAPSGLVVRTVRSRGYVLDHDGTASLPPRVGPVPG